MLLIKYYSVQTHSAVYKTLETTIWDVLKIFFYLVINNNKYSLHVVNNVIFSFNAQDVYKTLETTIWDVSKIVFYFVINNNKYSSHVVNNVILGFKGTRMFIKQLRSRFGMF